MRCKFPRLILRGAGWRKQADILRVVSNLWFWCPLTGATWNKLRSQCLDAIRVRAEINQFRQIEADVQELWNKQCSEFTYLRLGWQLLRIVFCGCIESAWFAPAAKTQSDICALHKWHSPCAYLSNNLPMPLHEKQVLEQPFLGATIS